MRRVWTLAGVTVLALLGANVTVARASRPTPRAAGEVISLSVVPALGRAEVVINVDGPVEVQDFTLASPARIVLDVTGATLGMPPRLYDRMRRGAITNVRMAQYKEEVVRVVIDLDRDHPYSVRREDGAVRVTIDAEATRFAAWHATPELASPVDRQETPAQNVAASQVGTQRNTANKGRIARAPVVAPQPRITVTYQDADIRDVISAFAVFSGRTIVVGKGVTGTVSAEVRDQPWDVALRAILQSQGLAAREDQDGIITVDSYEAIAAQQALEPLTTQIIEVNYARAASLRETIKGLLSKDCGTRPAANGAPAQPAANATCTTRGDVAVDSSTNRLIVTDVPSRLQDITNYVRDLDVRTPQVAIKAKIIFVNRTNIEDIGLSYDFGSKNQFFNKLVQRQDPSTFAPVDSDGDGINDALNGTPYPQGTNIIDLGGNSVSAIANANQRVVQPALELVYSAALGKFSLTAFLDALQEVRLADIQAEPSIVTLDNRKAEILVGEETPIRVIDLGAQAQAGQGGQQQQPRATVSFKETGIILQVTPHITNNRQILMTLHSERSNLQAAASDLGFTFQKQRADNQLLVADGETAVIGGLTVTQVTVSKVGIPVLVELPLVGKLFGSTRTQEEKRDLLILVTPHIIDEGERLGVPGGSR
ncbi:MAG TPA: AMIN domain-containing protein [Gemmatimonadaceae bacterium]|nr:AMIN domain-containing protein [Gemmatimonadaceae bacterium]